MSKTQAQLLAEINSSITTNGSGAITGAILNGVLQDMVNATFGDAVLTSLIVNGISNLTGATTIGGALTYGGVALTNAVTGTGSMVLSASPTFTGTIAASAANFTSAITGYSSTAIPAGGTTGTGIRVSSTANFGTFFGSGAPTLSAAQGSIYLRSDGGASTRLYINSNGTTGWSAIADTTATLIVGTSTITSGATTRILYDNAGVLGEYTITGTGSVVAMQTSPALVTPSLDVATGTSLALGGATIGTNTLAVTGPTTITESVGSSALTLTGATQTAANSLITGTQVWNNIGVIFTGIKGSFTDTNSAAASKVIDLLVGGATVFAVRKDSAAFFDKWATAAGTIIARADSGYLQTSGQFAIGGTDLFLFRDAANTLAQRNGTTAQALNVYNTFTDTSNYERGIIDWVTTANSLSIGTVALGTGTLRNIRLVGGTVAVISSTDASASSGSGSLQVSGGASVAKRFWIPAITASAGLQTAVLCQSSGGEMIADSVACLASSARFKILLGNAENGALDKIIRVPIHRWKYNRDPESVFPDNYYSEHIGPTAEDIEAIDSRLVGRDQEGRARSISTDQLLALAIQAIQEQQEQIEELKKTV